MILTAPAPTLDEARTIAQDAYTRGRHAALRDVLRLCGDADQAGLTVIRTRDVRALADPALPHAQAEAAP